jgi:hypothetical protein
MSPVIRKKDDFKNTNIEAISCPYNNTISDYFKIKTDDE